MKCIQKCVLCDFDVAKKKLRWARNSIIRMDYTKYSNKCICCFVLNDKKKDMKLLFLVVILVVNRNTRERANFFLKRHSTYIHTWCPRRVRFIFCSSYFFFCFSFTSSWIWIAVCGQMRLQRKTFIHRSRK